TAISIRGYRVGGTGARLTARKNGSDLHLTNPIDMTSADTWQYGQGSINNGSYSAGDKLELMIVDTTGNPTQLAIQVDFNIV
ncbi:hypothetical protein DRQ07_09290, partial [candidate division KSB1 bacterium]